MAQYQSIDPTLLALKVAKGFSNNTKKTVPIVSTTGTSLKPSLNVSTQQMQAPSANIGGIQSPFGAKNINSSPVLGGTTPQQIGQVQSQLNSLPKQIPASGTEPVAKLSIDDFANKIKEKYPEYADRDNKVLAEAMLKKYPEYADKVEAGQLPKESGYTIEGYNQQNNIPVKGNIKSQLIPQTIQRLSPISPSVEGTPYSPLKTIKNLPTSTANIGVDIANMALSPKETAKSLLGLVAGVGSNVGKFIGEKVSGMNEEEYNQARDKIINNGGTIGKIYDYFKKSEQGANAMGDYLKSYTDPAQLKKKLEEDPLSIIADLASMAEGGAPLIAKGAELAKLGRVAEIATKVGEIATKVNPYRIVPSIAMKGVGKVASLGTEVALGALGKMTGTSSDTIKQVYQSAKQGSNEARQGLRGNIDDSTVLENVKQGVEAVKDDRRTLYGNDYKLLESNKTPINIRQIAGETLNALHDDLNVTFNSKGKLDFSNSKITSPQAQANLQNIVSDIYKRKDTTPVGLDILKQRIKDYARYTPEFAKSDRFATLVSNKIKDAIIQQVPEYAGMMKNYEQASNLLSDIKSAISAGGKAGNSTIITKMKSIFRDNQEFRKAIVQKLESYTGKDILGQVAGLQMSSLLPKGLAGVGLGVGATYFLPHAIGTLLLTSPRLIGEFANAIGRTENKVNTFLDKIKSLNKTNASTISNNSIVANIKSNKGSNGGQKVVGKVKPKQVFTLGEKELSK